MVATPSVVPSQVVADTERVRRRMNKPRMCTSTWACMWFDRHSFNVHVSGTPHTTPAINSSVQQQQHATISNNTPTHIIIVSMVLPSESRSRSAKPRCDMQQSAAFPIAAFYIVHARAAVIDRAHINAAPASGAPKACCAMASRRSQGSNPTPIAISNQLVWHSETFVLVQPSCKDGQCRARSSQHSSIRAA